MNDVEWGAVGALAIGALIRVVPAVLAYLERRASAREAAQRARDRAGALRSLIKAGATPAEAAAAVRDVSTTRDEPRNAGARPGEGETG